MPNPYVSKVIIGGITKLDLTNDTVIAADIRSGVTAHNAAGALIEGTASWSYDAQTEALTVPSWALEVE